jgi:hypothetical protein
VLLAVVFFGVAEGAGSEEGSLTSSKCWDILQKTPDQIATNIQPKFYYKLACVGDVRAKQLLAQGVKSDDKKIRVEALYGLAKLGDSNASERLREYLLDRDQELQFTVARYLTDLGDKAGVDYLKKGLKTGFVNTVNRDKSSSLLRRVRNSQEKRRKISALYSLFKSGDAKRLSMIKEYFNDSDWSVRHNAFECLKESDRSAFDLFKKDLKNEDELSRIYTAEALLEAGDKSGVSVLKAALKSDHKGHRLTAARDLLCVGDRTGWGVIGPVLEKKAFGQLYNLAKMKCEVAIPYIKELLHESDKDKKLQGLELASMMNDPSLAKDIEPLLEDKEVKHIAAIVILKLLNPKQEPGRRDGKRNQ